MGFVKGIAGRVFYKHFDAAVNRMGEQLTDSATQHIVEAWNSTTVRGRPLPGARLGTSAQRENSEAIVSRRSASEFATELRASRAELMASSPSLHPANLLACRPLTPAEQKIYRDVIIRGAGLSRTVTHGKNTRAVMNLEGVNREELRARAENSQRATADFLVQNAHALSLSLDTAQRINRLLVGDQVREAGDAFVYSNPMPFFRWLESDAAHRMGLKDPVGLAERIHTEGANFDTFSEGNGRTFRMLADLALMKYGRAPVRYPDRAKYFATAGPLVSVHYSSADATTHYPAIRDAARRHFFRYANDGERWANRKLGRAPTQDAIATKLPPITDQYFMHGDVRHTDRTLPRYRAPEPLPPGQRPKNAKEYRRAMLTGQVTVEQTRLKMPWPRVKRGYRVHVQHAVPGVEPLWHDRIYSDPVTDLPQVVRVIHPRTGRVFHANPGEAGAVTAAGERSGPTVLRDVRGRVVQADWLLPSLKRGDQD